VVFCLRKSASRQPDLHRPGSEFSFQVSAFRFGAGRLHGRHLNSSRLILGFFGAAFVAVTLFAVSFFVQMHRDITALQAQEATNQRRLAEAQAKLAEQEKYLDQLRHDPALVERLIRQKLGYAKETEYVFRFEGERK